MASGRAAKFQRRIDWLERECDRERKRIAACGRAVDANGGYVTDAMNHVWDTHEARLARLEAEQLRLLVLVRAERRHELLMRDYPRVVVAPGAARGARGDGAGPAAAPALRPRQLLQ